MIGLGINIILLLIVAAVAIIWFLMWKLPKTIFHGGCGLMGLLRRKRFMVLYITILASLVFGLFTWRCDVMLHRAKNSSGIEEFVKMDSGEAAKARDKGIKAEDGENAWAFKYAYYTRNIFRLGIMHPEFADKFTDKYLDFDKAVYGDDGTDDWIRPFFYFLIYIICVPVYSAMMFYLVWFVAGVADLVLHLFLSDGRSHGSGGGSRAVQIKGPVFTSIAGRDASRL